MDKIKQTKILQENIKNFLSRKIITEQEESDTEKEVLFRKYTFKDNKKKPDESQTYVMFSQDNPSEDASRNEIASALLELFPGKKGEILGNVVFSFEKSIDVDIPIDQEDTLYFEEYAKQTTKTLDQIKKLLTGNFKNGFRITTDKKINTAYASNTSLASESTTGDALPSKIKDDSELSKLLNLKDTLTLKSVLIRNLGINQIYMIYTTDKINKPNGVAPQIYYDGTDGAAKPSIYGPVLILPGKVVDGINGIDLSDNGELINMKVRTATPTTENVLSEAEFINKMKTGLSNIGKSLVGSAGEKTTGLGTINLDITADDLYHKILVKLYNVKKPLICNVRAKDISEFKVGPDNVSKETLIGIFSNKLNKITTELDDMGEKGIYLVDENGKKQIVDLNDKTFRNHIDKAKYVTIDKGKNIVMYYYDWAKDQNYSKEDKNAEILYKELTGKDLKIMGPVYISKGVNIPYIDQTKKVHDEWINKINSLTKKYNYLFILNNGQISKYKDLNSITLAKNNDIKYYNALKDTDYIWIDKGTYMRYFTEQRNNTGETYENKVASMIYRQNVGKYETIYGPVLIIHRGM
jgi:hypothetical protein